MSLQKYKKCLSLYVPMLDITMRASSEKLAKGGLHLNLISQYNPSVHSNFHRDVLEFVRREKDSVFYHLGGASLNTQVHLARGTDLLCYFYGFIGRDRYGQLVKEYSEKSGVVSLFEESRSYSTPFCYVFLSGQDRTLMAHQLPTPRLNKESMRRFIEQMGSDTVVYFVSFMFNMPLMVEDGREILAHKKEKKFCMILNLSSNEAIRSYHGTVLEFVEHADFLIGNREEAMELCRCATGKSPTDSELMAYLESLGVSYAITDGEKDVVGRLAGGEKGDLPSVVNPPRLSGDLNTNGAGDAFAAGFISKLNTHNSIEDLIKSGIEFSQRHIWCKNRIPRKASVATLK